MAVRQDWVDVAKPVSPMIRVFKSMSMMVVLLLLVFASNGRANYFKDELNSGFDTAIWQARTGINGAPFGCAFVPSLILPASHGITLTLQPGKCAELQTKQFYGFGKIQGALKTGNSPGTVSSIFTYTSWWDEPGRAWQEIDIEFLPSLGNVVHTNVIYQPQHGKYQSWELDVDLTQYGLNVQQAVLTVGFEWTATEIRWYVYDAKGHEQTIRTVRKANDDGHLTAHEIPAYAWPVEPTRIMLNHWHGDNSAAGYQFPGWYDRQSAWAYYDFIEYIPQIIQLNPQQNRLHR